MLKEKHAVKTWCLTSSDCFKGVSLRWPWLTQMPVGKQTVLWASVSRGVERGLVLHLSWGTSLIAKVRLIYYIKPLTVRLEPLMVSVCACHRRGNLLRIVQPSYSEDRGAEAGEEVGWQPDVLERCIARVQHNWLRHETGAYFCNRWGACQQGEHSLKATCKLRRPS